MVLLLAGDRGFHVVLVQLGPSVLSRKFAPFGAKNRKQAKLHASGFIIIVILQFGK